MVKFDLDSTSQSLLIKTKRNFLNEEDLKTHCSSSFNTYCTLPVKNTLKAIYPHFIQSKRKDKERPNNFSLEEDVLSYSELKLAMEEAKNAYDTMQNIQKQLHQVYKELKLLKLKK
jgi:hypothetical protein